MSASGTFWLGKCRPDAKGRAVAVHKVTVFRTLSMASTVRTIVNYFGRHYDNRFSNTQERTH